MKLIFRWKNGKLRPMFVQEEYTNKTTSEYMNEKIRKNQNEEFTDSKGNKHTFKKVNGKDFKKALDEAKAKLPPEKAWRVDNTSHTIEEYDNMKCYTTENGSTVAITNDGDIISVASTKKGEGRSLMEFAVNHKGVKLDSYDGNYEYYTHMGFKPISWTKFNEIHAPSDWNKNRDDKEPIIFFKYVGKEVTISKDDFYNSTKDFKEYDDAMKERDKHIKRGDD